MTTLTNELHDLIVDRVGRFNTDILLGWEDGLKGKRRIGGKLYNRHPPDHFTGTRADDWYCGYSAGLSEHGRQACRKRTTFGGVNKDGGVVVSRKGWSVRRGEVVTQMERKGCYGLVLVQYWDGSTVVRSVNCQI